MIMGLTPDPVVRTLFALFVCVLKVLLVLLVVWGLYILYQQESSTNVMFFICRVCINMSQFQIWLTHRNVLTLKFLIFFQI